MAASAPICRGYGRLLVDTNNWDRNVLERFLADPVVSRVPGLDVSGTTEQLEHAAELLPDEWLVNIATGSPQDACAPSAINSN